MDDTIEIRVKPNQSEFKIMLNEEGQVTVNLKSKPEKNEANIELVRMFTKILKKPVYLVSGPKSKSKMLKIEGMTRKEVLDALSIMDSKHIHNSHTHHKDV